MARLALSDALGRRGGGSGCALSRPALSREIGCDWAKVFLGEAFGDGGHDRVVALAIPVVAHLFEKIAPLLPPDDRDSVGIGGHTILAVTGCTELSLGLDVVGGMPWQGNTCNTNGGTGKGRKYPSEHGLTPASLCQPCRLYRGLNSAAQCGPRTCSGKRSYRPSPSGIRSLHCGRQHSRLRLTTGGIPPQDVRTAQVIRCAHIRAHRWLRSRGHVAGALPSSVHELAALHWLFP